VFEGRQGVSYGRNAGAAASRAPILAFTDDDVRVSSDWLSVLHGTLERHPDAAYIGGRCLPIWPAEVPAWLTREHWAPLALFDYGEEPFVTSLETQRCLGSGNMGIRREVFERVGGFDPRTQHAKGSVAAAEDHQLNLRIWQLGLTGRYVPELVIHSEVPLARMTRRYHRKWHNDHGRAMVHLLPAGHLLDQLGRVQPAPEARRIGGVPTRVLREAAWHARQYLWASIRGRRAEALWFEFQAREAGGSALEFWRTRS
jgi:cellulose synthase/poly-beta-1,6-N-acetylglucosamine synthase-like glycosyltransferase